MTHKSGRTATAAEEELLVTAEIVKKLLDLNLKAARSKTSL
jgi:hypothetical protein